MNQMYDAFSFDIICLSPDNCVNNDSMFVIQLTPGVLTTYGHIDYRAEPVDCF